MTATHLLLNLKGSYRTGPFSAGGEIWQTGIRLAVLSAGDFPPEDIGPLEAFDVRANPGAHADATQSTTSNWDVQVGATVWDPVDWLAHVAFPAASALIASANFCSDTQLDALALYPIRTPDGRVEPAPGFSQGSPCLLTVLGTKPFGTGAQGLPPQNSIVASLRTAQTGRRGRGRMYLPPPPVSMMSNLVLSAASTLAVGNAMVTFLEALRVHIDPEDIWIAPIVTGAPYTAYGAITSVQVDNVVDTQSRRRRSISPTVDISPVDPWAA
jgi:hypothetical protein